ncbi:sulfatase family protein [Flavobacterium algicola]|uniref:sulfatase family protein n=1 Tax=Flavobacterium algicola TaxID=556529 RepID=UPI001EFDBC07|nr:arylsulfatase [Flavobacterium algicola]MCG9792352.1 arylsulfatase [Flavobacterium algicola]
MKSVIKVPFLKLQLKLTIILFSALTMCGAYAQESVNKKSPNIVYILCDDLGYGDVQCLNPDRGKIATPNMDQLRSEGMSFTDAHSSSSVCTPSRYSVLTGRYAWRTHLQARVLSGNGKPLIESGRLTVGGLLKQHGYTAAAIGKWHLGLNYDSNDYSKVITDGPLQHGFDYFFGIAGSADMPPYDFIENDHFTQIPSVQKQFPSLTYGSVSKRGPARLGPAAPDYEAENVLPTITTKAVDYLDERGKDKKPFFLYLALPSPHTPLVPSKEWQNKSGLGPYGDFVMQTDWALGEVMKAIEKAGLNKNTMVIFTSDNGVAPYIGVHELEALGHYPSAEFRGYKLDIWEGGHRVPFFVRWPGKIKANSQSNEVICLSNLLATSAELVGAKLPDNAGEDSFSLLPTILEKTNKQQSHAIVNHSWTGRFAIRQGNWKLELCPGSGGTGGAGELTGPDAIAAGLPPIQLYNIHEDLAEKVNLQHQDPKIVASLTKLLEQYVANGRSTPGKPQRNDVPIDIWKKQLNEQPLTKAKNKNEGE